MPAAIVHYLFAKRVQEALYKAGQQIPNQDAFLWGAQGTAVLDALQDSRLTVAAGQLAKQSLADLSVQLHDCCSGVESDALRSCAMGFLCSEQLERAAAPFVAWCAEQMYTRDNSQPKHIWKNEEESALDSILLRYECGALPTEFSLLQALPKSGTAQAAFAKMYAGLLEKAELPNTEILCSRAADECRRLYRRMTDRTGLKRVFYLRRENGRLHEMSSRLRSFTEDGSFDYANVAQAVWQTGEKQDSRTFLQLYDETIPLAAEEINRWNAAQIQKTLNKTGEKAV